MGSNAEKTGVAIELLHLLCKICDSGTVGDPQLTQKTPLART